ncbi:hypothetical protein ACLBWS_17835, partial [Brucellaceae bacterium D45D]
MTELCSSLYHRHRFPAEIISEAVWLYFCFPLSFRMVEDLLAYRGIIVTHKTVWTCFGKVERHFSTRRPFVRTELGSDSRVTNDGG